MIVVTATLQAKAGKEKEVEEAFRAILPRVQTETGTVVYILHRAADHHGKFFLYESYKDKEAFDHHASTPYLKDLFGKLKDLLDGPAVIEFFEEIDRVRR
jgi:quinol monooxygenase YgiN